jgi:hypothetical protein
MSGHDYGIFLRIRSRVLLLLRLDYRLSCIVTTADYLANLIKPKSRWESYCSSILYEAARRMTGSYFAKNLPRGQRALSG